MNIFLRIYYSSSDSDSITLCKVNVFSRGETNKIYNPIVNGIIFFGTK